MKNVGVLPRTERLRSLAPVTKRPKWSRLGAAWPELRAKPAAKFLIFRISTLLMYRMERRDGVGGGGGGKYILLSYIVQHSAGVVRGKRTD